MDASLKWKVAVEEVLIDLLGLIPNCTDNCVYSGVVKGDPVVLGRATDNFLIATSELAHDYIVGVLRHKTNGSMRWLIHGYGLATYYFGIRVVQSKD